MLKYCILALGAAFAARLNAQSTMSCAASAAAPAAIRAESLADQVSDIVITCTGGTPAAAGASVAQYQVLVISDAPLATRTFIPVVTTPTVPDPNAPLPSVLYWTEALLLVDEPAQSSQIPCVPADGSGVCAIKAGDASAPNVFQAQRLQDNMLVFPKIPIDAPGPGKSRTIRITNLRVDGTKVSKDSLQTTLQAQIFDRSGNLLSLTGASQVAAVVNPGYKFSIRTAADSDPGVGPGLLVTPTMLPQSTPGTSVAFHVKFTEGFPSAFKRRNLGTNSLDPTFLVSQADPVGPSNTETGFYNSAFPQTNNLNTAGLADSGTRLRLVLTDIPDNVFLEVSARDVSVGTTGYSDAAPRALLTYADDNGGGSFSQNHPGVNGLFSVMQVYAGTVTLTWEVVAADPNKIEDYSFEIRLFSPNGVAKLGTAMAHGTVGPIYPGVTTAPSGTPTVMPVPAFTDSTADPVPAFELVPTLSTGFLASVSAASFSPFVAPESLVAGFGSDLVSNTDIAGAIPVLTLGGNVLNIIDNTGTIRQAPLLMVSPGQVNFQVPSGTAAGEAVVNLSRGSQTIATGYLRVGSVAPALFSANGNGQGVALGTATMATSGTTIPLETFDSTQQAWVPAPIDLGADSIVTLTLYATGVRGRSSLDNVKLTIGGTPVAVTFAGPLGQLAGVDEIDAGPLPHSLSGRGPVPVVLTVDGKVSNSLTAQFK